MFDNTPNDPSKFKEKIYDDSSETYNTNRQIKFNAKVDLI